MNGGIVVTWQQLLYGTLVLILFYVAQLLLFLRKNNRVGPGRDLHHQLEVQRGEIAALRQEVEGLKVRLAALQLQQPALIQDGNAGHPLSDAEEETPYAQAIRMARLGADANHVASACGLTRGEADLIVALYRRNE
ncbi:Protein of unknown function [Andreprevotia lacus DSM 23236]|jgi:hypothetical protein|uniref:DUF2802 domain-containing protein n=1 Tax=Andreprevotia lacus DSM 23236 TaxID=1121001 RepID=A0A1W1XHJ9_9NEIS|nr:DUF2802 domain-containing protein [Andreprevotia lacus]SMC23465.1 Protein of unknown function [Andreprevotia lacus DSM 23236]